MPRFHHLLLPALALLFLAIYNTCLVDLYAYEGMVPVALDLDFWIVFTFTIFIVLLVLPSRIERPSDLFLLFYLLISVVWGTVLWSGTGLIETDDQPLFFLVLILPPFAVVALRGTVRDYVFHVLYPVQLASRFWLSFVLAALLLVGGLAAYTTVGGGNFNWDEMYVRRLAGRDAFAGQVFASYAMTMSTNGMLPLLGFIAGLRRSPVLFAIAVAFVVMMFFLLGLKSPAINFVALAGLGYCFRYRSLRRNMVPITLLAFMAVYSVSLYAFMADQNTVLADYLVRRISMVQPQVQSYYFDYWLHRDAAEQLLANARQSFSDLTFAIGYLYLHNPLTNANTNAFIYSLAKGGIIAYVFSILVVVVFLSAVDALAEKTKGPEFFAISALFTVLLSEQAWTTVLLTSGIALGLTLVMLFSHPARGSAITAR